MGPPADGARCARRLRRYASIKQPGGFRLPLPPAERIWPTPSGKAEFFVFDGLAEDDEVDEAGMLRLATIRSHDQYNTTIYAMDDRYRGGFGRRDILFMNEGDLTSRGLEHGDRVDIETISKNGTRRMEGLTVVAYDIAAGSAAAYYPEANRLVPLDYLDKQSGTPSYKSVPVRVTRSSLHSPEDAPI